MDHTKNYRLPQWIKSDRIMMDDFNQAMSNIESGMTGNAQAAAEAKSCADNAQDTADQAMDAAQNAQSDADKALDAAGQAQTSADTARKEAAVLPYVTGSYVGTGSDMKITVGFRPAFLIISGMKPSTLSNMFEDMQCSGFVGKNTMEMRCKLERDGFTVLAYNGFGYPDFVEKDRRYDYIAFR